MYVYSVYSACSYPRLCAAIYHLLPLSLLLLCWFLHCIFQFSVLIYCHHLFRHTHFDAYLLLSLRDAPSFRSQDNTAASTQPCVRLTFDVSGIFATTLTNNFIDMVCICQSCRFAVSRACQFQCVCVYARHSFLQLLLLFFFYTMQKKTVDDYNYSLHSSYIKFQYPWINFRNNVRLLQMFQNMKNVFHNLNLELNGGDNYKIHYL